MDSSDKFFIGFLILWILFFIFAIVRNRRRPSEKKFMKRQFLVSWATPVVLNISYLLRHHTSKVYPYAPDIIGVIWLGVMIWNLIRMSDESRRKEIAEGRVPKVYNDWAKPDKL